jgi:predicted transcriptional regulator
MLKPMSADAHDVKQAAHQLIDQLPDNVGWDELAYRMGVRASIERGLADSEAGRLIPHEDILREFGLTRDGE